MSNIYDVNLKVLLMDTDFYALNAINGFLAWDRRTRVTAMCETIEAMWAYIERTPLAELPHVVLLEPDHVGGPDALRTIIRRLRSVIEGVRVMCLAQVTDMALVEAAADSGAAGYLLKSDVRLQIAWALVYAAQRQLDFVVTATVARFCAGSANRRLLYAYTLPERRKFPELTDRIHQALWLCVVKGMPAQLAADEMGISLHTIRGYIKEGYRILEAYDETEFPLYMTPQEKAFMRLTAFADDDDRSRPSLAH